MRILITGAYGFIGSAMARRLAKGIWDSNKGWLPYEVVLFARNTNQWSSRRLNDDQNTKERLESGAYRLVFGDLNSDISGLCEGVDIVYHFAAKTYVDHSIKDPSTFHKSNTEGTVNLLEEARRQGVKAFISISTDEVYGQILEGAYSENAPINPRNPYAASKAAADAFVISYAHSYPKMWTAVTRTENNYGPYQHPQKVIPAFIKCIVENKPLQIYGDGEHVRQWLHVDDHVNAQCLFLTQWNNLPSGNVWHIAGSQECTNNKLADLIISCFPWKKEKVQKVYVDDMNIRPGHDRRYALNCDKVMRALGWEPDVELKKGIDECVSWYLGHNYW